MRALLGVDVEKDLYAAEFLLVEELVAGVEDELFGLADGFACGETQHYAFVVEVANAGDVGVFGSDDAVGEEGAQLGGECGSGFVNEILVGVAECNDDEAIVGRIFEDAPFDNLAFVHRVVVVVHCVADGLMVGLVGLDDDLALPSASSGATADLCHLLEAALVGAEIGIGNEVVGGEDSDDADVVEVESLGDHLCADKDVDAVFVEIVEDFYILVFLRCRIEIHTCYARLGEEDSEVVFDAFGAEASHSERRGMAGRAFGGDGYGVAAIVAAEAVGGLVVDERDVAVLALRYPVADIALEPE